MLVDRIIAELSGSSGLELLQAAKEDKVQSLKETCGMVRKCQGNDLVLSLDL
jgi:hypothetical protein